MLDPFILLSQDEPTLRPFEPEDLVLLRGRLVDGLGVARVYRVVPPRILWIILLAIPLVLLVLHILLDLEIVLLVVVHEAGGVALKLVQLALKIPLTVVLVERRLENEDVLQNLERPSEVEYGLDHLLHRVVVDYLQAGAYVLGKSLTELLGDELVVDVQVLEVCRVEHVKLDLLLLLELAVFSRRCWATLLHDECVSRHPNHDLVESLVDY